MKRLQQLGYCFWIIVILFGAVSCNHQETLFEKVSSGHSGITFNNKIVENDSVNPIDMTNVYNGGGVGVGDFNNDGLQDLYFTGNMVSNKLYLNKGDFRFDDITDAAGVNGSGKWCRGVSVVDINNDGWQDIYVSASMLKDPLKRENLLYINQGVKNKVPQFREMAAEYGLNDTLHGTMAAFFDYDNDGDLDVYLVVNQIIKEDNPAVFRPKITDGSYRSTGQLYRNDPGKGHPYFTNVTKQAGTTIEGYGHSVTISDFNLDGWKDIFVTNDFNSNDLLYINNGNGTFTDKASSYFKHTSANGMGQDVIDINNDGLSDVVELDMNPQDNYRKKMMMNANSYQIYQNSDLYGYQYQYVRNTLQLNQGPRVVGDSIGDPVFSDVGFYAGIAETDWSWTPLVQDFNNDGLRDIIITNGFPKDVTDHDFIAFRSQSFSVASKEYTLSQIPQVKLHNYAFQNNGGMRFSDVSAHWGFQTPSFSNGAAYADLDNDGDLDVVINNINDEAFVYRNQLQQEHKNEHYLAVDLKGNDGNRNALGAWVEVYAGGKKQVYEQTPYRGYLSSIQLQPHFGLGSTSVADSVVVIWPDGKKSVVFNVASDQTVAVDYKNAIGTFLWGHPSITQHTLLKNITDSLGIHYRHEERDFVDFNIQKLLPHKFSEYGPALAVGDLDGNGLEDLVVGGSMAQPGSLFLQQPAGFVRKTLSMATTGKTTEELGIALFDAEGDGDLDLYMASGGFEQQPGSAAYQDRLFLNNGRGSFTEDTAALPKIFTSKSCVRPVDFDKDGDLDLFVAGRVEPWNYPKPVSSYLFRNDSKNGIVHFTDVSSQLAPALQNIGLVCDAVWTDFDNDGWQDLLLAGEWMPLTFLKNNKGVFQKAAVTGLDDKKGWWTSILPGDFDNDGDMDYIVGNLGQNSFYRASKAEPVRMYAKDFDNNGSYDAVPTVYLPASHTDTSRKEFPVHVRDDITKQMIVFKSKFQNYKQFASATFSQMFTPDEMKGALKLEANYFSNSLLRNKGNGTFEVVALPPSVQYACMNGMVAEDFNGDGNLDLLVSGNDFGTEVSVGRYDACNGWLLQGDGKGNFSPLTMLQSGWFLPGNAKAVVTLSNAKGETLVAASQNRGPLQLFRVRNAERKIPVRASDEQAWIRLRNGAVQKRELNWGASFLSQSSRFVSVPAGATQVTIMDAKGTKRSIDIAN